MNRFRYDQYNACGKRCYSEFGALLAIAKAVPNKWGIKPVRKYKCEKCHQWHLSSKTEEEHQANLRKKEETHGI